MNSYDFIFFFFFLVLVSIEKVSQKLKTVFDHISTQFEARRKILHLRVVFSIFFSVFGNVVEHGLSCLIYIT